MFERVAGEQGWPKELRVTQLAGLLSREALDAFTSVPTESARSYDAVKEAILARFQVMPRLIVFGSGAPILVWENPISCY